MRFRVEQGPDCSCLDVMLCSLEIPRDCQMHLEVFIKEICVLIQSLWLQGIVCWKDHAGGRETSQKL